MAKKIDIPEPPEYFRYDYAHDLALARMSQMAFANESEMNAARNASFEPRERTLPTNWAPDRKFELKQNENTGFAAWVFREEGTRNLVVAFRGNDDRKDWMGPTLQTVADGPVLDKVVQLINPLGTGLHGQAAELATKLQTTAVRNWHPQFDDALDLVRDVQKAYPGHSVEVTGAGMGGALAQVCAHAYGLPGRSFDAPGAANIVGSADYKKWVGKNGLPNIPPQPSRDTAERGQHEAGAFINYKVNHSPLSNDTGPHLGDHDRLTSLSGQATLADGLKHGGREVLEGIASVPMLGKIPRIGKEVEWLSKYAQVLMTGKDVSEIGNIDHVVTVMEATLQRGKLQRWGQQGEEPEATTQTTRAERSEQPSTSEPGSIGDLFNRLAEAARADDLAGMHAVTQEYMQSAKGQQFLQAGRDAFEAEQAAELARQRALAEQQSAPMRPGPAMRM